MPGGSKLLQSIACVLAKTRWPRLPSKWLIRRSDSLCTPHARRTMRVGCSRRAGGRARFLGAYFTSSSSPVHTWVQDTFAAADNVMCSNAARQGTADQLAKSPPALPSQRFSCLTHPPPPISIHWRLTQIQRWLSGAECSRRRLCPSNMINCNWMYLCSTVTA